MQEASMAETTTITIRISTETKAKLDRLAGITDRSRSYLAAEALEIYTRNELEIVDQILEGIADDDAGRVFTTDEVKASVDKIIADAEKTRRSA
jgi:predicted transcriptional regulator